MKKNLSLLEKVIPKTARMLLMVKKRGSYHPNFRNCLSVCVEIDIFGTIQENNMLPISRSASYRSLARA